MSTYIEKMHTDKIHFPSAHANFLHKLLYLVDSLKDEKEIRLRINGGYAKYRDCVKEEDLKGIILDIRWEQDGTGYETVTCRAVIKPKVVLSQLNKYCAE